MLDTSSRKQHPTPLSDWELCKEEIDDMAANPKMWLASKHINAVSAIARHQFPTIGAFYNVQWAYGDGYPQTSQPNWSQFCLKDQNHWVLLSNGLNQQNFVSIYDSKNSNGDNSKIAESIIIAACQILKTPGQYVRIGHVPCDWQHDGFNCGIFAIANATCLALGVDPSDLQFDVSKMRNHFLDCLRKKEMSAFPLVKRRTGRTTAKKVVSEPKQVEVFCTCRCPAYYKSKPGDEVSLVECDGEDCKTRWFHPACEGITEKELKNIKHNDWFCSCCTRNGHFKSTSSSPLSSIETSSE